MISERDRAGQLYRDVLAVFTRKQHLDSVQVLLHLFLTARGQPLPQLAKVKSPAAVSRFLNRYDWNLRAIIRIMRRYALEQFQLYRNHSRGRAPNVELIVDMTSLPKEGKFPLLNDWMHHFNGVTGVHLVVLYISCGEIRLPWSFLIWRGKHQTSPAELALKMLARLPAQFRQGRTAPHVLADAGFSGRKFIAGVVKLGLTVSVSIQANKVLDTGRAIRQVRRQGQAIFLKDLPQIPLWLYWVWLPAKTGQSKEKRYVVSTIWWTPSTIRKKGRRRWRIEALFKTLKSGQASSWASVLPKTVDLDFIDLVSTPRLAFYATFACVCSVFCSVISRIWRMWRQITVLHPGRIGVSLRVEFDFIAVVRYALRSWKRSSQAFGLFWTAFYNFESKLQDLR